VQGQALLQSRRETLVAGFYIHSAPTGGRELPPALFGLFDLFRGFFSLVPLKTKSSSLFVPHPPYFRSRRFREAKGPLPTSPFPEPGASRLLFSELTLPLFSSWTGELACFGAPNSPSRFPFLLRSDLTLLPNSPALFPRADGSYGKNIRIPRSPPFPLS